MDISQILEAATVAESVNRYVGVVQEGIGVKLDQLIRSEFAAGMRALQQASQAQSEPLSLLREARSRLNKAAALETRLRLALTHVGLAICHHHLGDENNARQSLREALAVSVSMNLKTDVMKPLAWALPVGMAATVFTGGIGLAVGILAAVIVKESYSQTSENIHLDTLQQGIKQYLDTH